MGEDESLGKCFIERIGNIQERHDFSKSANRSMRQNTETLGKFLLLIKWSSSKKHTPVIIKVVTKIKYKLLKQREIEKSSKGEINSNIKLVSLDVLVTNRRRCSSIQKHPIK